MHNLYSIKIKLFCTSVFLEFQFYSVSKYAMKKHISLRFIVKICLNKPEGKEVDQRFILLSSNTNEHTEKSQILSDKNLNLMT